MITLYPRKITLAQVDDVDHVNDLMAWLKVLINETYGNRQGIEPVYEKAETLNVMDVVKLLPGITDRKYCKQCGEVSCLLFATKLLEEKIHITKCQLLFTDKYKHNRDRLLELLEAAGYCVHKDF